MVHTHTFEARDMETATDIDRAELLGRSTLNAGEYLGLKRGEIAEIVGRDRSSIQRKGIDAESKSGEFSLLLIRIYRSLYALFGGNQVNIKHFIDTHNRGTGGVPREQMRSAVGIVTVCQYLDAMRGKG
jgi:hypothetical protein